VLIVEDSEPDALLIIRELRRGGYEPTVERVQTAEAMRMALADRVWDVVLADYSMPGFGATAALMVVKEIGLDIPFIIVSGTIGEDTAVEAMRAGAHDFLVKGNLARLLPALEREIRDAEVRRETIAERVRAEAEREKLLRELREAVRARDVFLMIASHELRTPLTALQLQVHFLQRPERAPLDKMPVQELEAALQMVARQVTRLRTLIENLLDVVHITSGGMTLSREPVNLRDVVAEIVPQLCHITRSRPDVIVEAQPVVGSWDRLRVESVVANLISNALKFGEGKPIAVTISSDGKMARLAVSDQGIGISPEEQSRIFEKFERAVSERHYGGFGLGLWIVRQIVEAHGGTIQLASEMGRGSTFVVELPLALPPGSGQP
jgi:signal transduction histidine kinase